MRLTACRAQRLHVGQVVSHHEASQYVGLVVADLLNGYLEELIMCRTTASTIDGKDAGGAGLFLAVAPTQTNAPNHLLTHTAIFENGDFVAVAASCFLVIIRDNS